MGPHPPRLTVEESESLWGGDGQKVESSILNGWASKAKNCLSLSIDI